MVNGRTTEDELQWITTPIQQSWKKYVKDNKLDMELNCVINKVLILTPESTAGTGGSVAELERRERSHRTAATSLSLLRQGLEVQYQGPAGHHRSQTLRSVRRGGRAASPTPTCSS